MDPSIKLSPAEREEHENDIYTLYINGATRRQMLKYAYENHWGLSETSIDAYIRKAKAKARAAAKYKEEIELGKAILRYDELYRRAMTEKDLRVARLIVGDMVTLMGLAAPQKQEIQHTISQDTEYKELRQIIDTYLKENPAAKAELVARLKETESEEETPADP